MSWIVDISEAQIGQVWTKENHEALVHQVREVEKVVQLLLKKVTEHAGQ